MILAIIDDAAGSSPSIKEAVEPINEIESVESMTLLESFDTMAVLSFDDPAVRPDLILISFKKRQEAFELVLAVKSDEKYAATPIISFGHENTESIMQSVQEAGCMDYIGNIGDKTEIFARVKTALSLRQETLGRLLLEQEIEENTAKLEKVTNIDALTGLLSKKYFEHKAAEEISRAIRSGYYISIIKLDIVDFSGFNKKYGFLEGDKVLRRIATALRKSVSRPGDLLARVGGDSFALFLPSTDLKGAEFIGKAALKNIKLLAIAHETDVGSLMTVHICGLGLTPTLNDNAAELLERICRITAECKVGVTEEEHFFCIKN